MNFQTGSHQSSRYIIRRTIVAGLRIQRQCQSRQLVMVASLIPGQLSGEAAAYRRGISTSRVEKVCAQLRLSGQLQAATITACPRSATPL